MLISFTVENWKSFLEPATLNMVASREKQHLDRVPHIPEHKLRLLPVTALYGGNASGKTNLVDALTFARELVVEGTRPDEPIAVQPFLLDPKATQRPSTFTFELLIGNTCYQFGFSVTRTGVEHEWLTEIKRTIEKPIYKREGHIYNLTVKGKDKKLWKMVSEATRDNQLFLTTAVDFNLGLPKIFFDWFRDSLRIISPSTSFRGFTNSIETSATFINLVSSFISEIDTGIMKLETQEIKEDMSYIQKGYPDVFSKSHEGKNIAVILGEDNYVVQEKNGNSSYKKIVSQHIDIEGNEVSFDFSQESSGTRRSLTIIPSFAILSRQNSERLLVIDELDRSLHTLLTKYLMEMFLNSVTHESRSQLIFTTHDVLLMDQDLLRRDEMWVTERDRQGRSTLISFSDYKDIRYDKDIRKSYLQGRLGGIPRILLSRTILPRKTKPVDGVE
jgi:AAA15 family ATPase/GTPase